MNILTTFFIVSLFIMTGCRSGKTDFNSEAAFNNYISQPSNGFIQIEETEELRFEARLTPTSNLNPDQLTVQLRISRLDGKSVLLSNDATKAEALEKEGYLSFDVSKDVWLEDEQNVYPSIFHHYERNYNIKPSIDVLFSFKSFEPQSDIYFVFQDQLFQQGLVRIKFNKDQFTNCHVK